MSDSDDSSDSSDIECMLNKVRQNKKRPSIEVKESGSSECGSDDDYDDDESDSDNGEENYENFDATTTSRRSKKKKSIGSELALMEQRRAITSRRLRERMKQDMDSDDEDEEVQEVIKKDKHAISIVMESCVEGEEIKVDDSSDDDDDDDKDKTKVEIPQSAVLAELAKAAASLQSAQQYQPSTTFIPAVSHATSQFQTSTMMLQQTAQLQAASASLAAAQPRDAAFLQQQMHFLLQQPGFHPSMMAALQNFNTNVNLAGLNAMSNLNMASPAAATASIPTQIQVTVVAELVCPGSTASADDQDRNSPPSTTTLSILTNEPLSVLQSKLLASLGYSPDAAIVTLTCQQQTLKPKQTAQSYKLTTGATIHAKVHLMGLQMKMMGDKKKMDMGNSIRLMLRRSNGNEVEVKTYMKEPFQALLDKFCQRTNTSNKNASLKFDGELLNLAQTPESLDMDDEDLIDVVEK